MRVLIVEDEPAIADALLFALAKEGFETLHAPTLLRAKELAANSDFLVLDVGLPDGNGFDFLREFRAESQTPVLLLTARAEEVDRIVGLEMGADDYVVKPFSPREVAARVRAILRRVRAPVSDQSSSFLVDEKKQIIKYKTRALVLSRTEYRILTLLIEKPGWVYSREKIMDLAWDEPEESFDRAVDTHIKNIRARLKEIDPHTDPIVTHRGAGYSLREDV
jgi:two-component system catabolic regulation response regulator CreB